MLEKKMSEMIKKVSDALSKSFADMKEGVDFDQLAKTAIYAMTEPTPDMKAAGDACDDWGSHDRIGHGNAKAAEHWDAMISSALPNDAR
jgi:hypothetical protein